MDSLGPLPEINVLLLGDAEVGKSTFLSCVQLLPLRAATSILVMHSLSSIKADAARRLSLGLHLRDDTLPPYELPTLRDSDQPFQFNVTLYRRPYALNFFDTASPTNYTLLRPDFIILCYDISKRSSLSSLRTHWRNIVNMHFNYDEALPVLILGLKRDLRKEWTEEERKDGGRGESVMPQEGLGVAQEMLCDMYAECSALTGELCREVLEDVARTCAKTTTEKGAKSQGTNCIVM
jgi:GTPase SAR1 family protein